ncbi:prenyltransferase [Geomicrobium halophilum]|nr:prenyltransferase [Geomicrobium halophilum]
MITNQGLISPAILSGGSRVIQTGHISFETMRKMGKWLVITLIIASFLLAVFGFPRISILLLIGVWGAASYSLSPLQFSYRPFAGDWFSLFPALFFLGIAGAWLALGHIPEWALQNATINALFCMAWVMVHHIPDIKADQQASPKKQTSVVWSAEKLGIARFPALLYLSLIGLSTLWLGMDRMWAAIGVLFIVGVAIFLVAKMKTEDHEQVSAIEKMLLLLAVVTAIWLGIFI